VYQKGLNYAELLTLHTYTYQGDVLMNNYLRNSFDVNKYKEHVKKGKTDYNTTYFPLFIPFIKILKDNIDNVMEILNPEILLASRKKFVKQIKMKKELFLTDFKEIKNKGALYQFIVKNALMLSDESIIEAVSSLCKILQTVIDNAPPVKKKMIVYRGSNDYYFDKDIRNIFYKNMGFVSSSIDKSSAFSFTVEQTDHPGRCCLSYITLLPGTKTVWLEGVTSMKGEYEFLLGLNTHYLIRKHKVPSVMYWDSNRHSKNTDICNKYNGQSYLASSIVAL
jgi:hypothetical protein